MKKDLSPKPGIISLANIERSILTIKELRVILSADLARFYDVEVRALNQAVKRNLDRFPADFMFALSQDDWDNLKSQSVISSWGGARTPPLAFTELGVAMLSSVLRTDRAIRVNIQIMRAFVELRKASIEHKELAKKLETLEKKYDYQFSEVFEAIRQLTTPPVKPRRKIGFI